EERTRVPRCALVLAQAIAELRLGDLQHAYFQLIVDLAAADEEVQTAPGALHLLELFVVQNLVDLRAEHAVKLADHALDGLDGVLGDDGGVAQGPLGERRHGRLNRLLALVRRWLEAFLQELGKAALGGQQLELWLSGRTVDGLWFHDAHSLFPFGSASFSA